MSTLISRQLKRSYALYAFLNNNFNLKVYLRDMNNVYLWEIYDIHLTNCLAH